jgi:cyclase
MLKVRVIPVLLWSDFGLVKGRQFLNNRRIGSVLPTLQIFNSRDVDELVLLDVLATRDSMKPRFEEISEYSRYCRVPFSVGGGIKSIDQIEKMLKIGADKVVINSAAYDDLNIVREASNRFGSQCIIVSIDFKVVEGTAICMSHSGTQLQRVSPDLWAKKVSDAGAGEILLTSIDRDGMRCGYDLDILKKVTDSVDIPVIVAGGAQSYEDLALAIINGGASAVAAASIFQFSELTPSAAKNYLRENGIPVRVG